jgi:hypothetical protein
MSGSQLSSLRAMLDQPSTSPVNMEKSISPTFPGKDTLTDDMSTHRKIQGKALYSARYSYWKKVLLAWKGHEICRETLPDTNPVPLLAAYIHNECFGSQIQPLLKRLIIISWAVKIKDHCIGSAPGTCRSHWMLVPCPSQVFLGGGGGRIALFSFGLSSSKNILGVGMHRAF